MLTRPPKPVDTLEALQAERDEVIERVFVFQTRLRQLKREIAAEKSRRNGRQSPGGTSS